MKKIITLLLVTFIATTSIAQMRPGRAIGKMKINWYKTGWFIDGNGGLRFLGETSPMAEMSIDPTINGGIGYFFNDKIGIKGRVDAHKFTASYNGKEDQSMVINTSAEVMLRMIQIFHHRRARKFALNLHAGAGLSQLINPSLRKQVENNGGDYDGKLFNADNMGHIIVGLTPQYHINSRISINLDVTHFTQLKQNNTYDSHNGVRAKDVTGILSTTIGLTFRP